MIRTFAMLCTAALCVTVHAGPSVDRDFFCSLLKIPSITSDIPKVNEAVKFVRSHLESAGVPCTVEEDSNGRRALYASTRPGKVMDYLFVVHLDVVPAGPEQFNPRIENGKVYARGAYDCKGNAAIAARLLVDLLGKASVGVVFSSDEETGGSTTKMMVDRGYAANKLVLVVDSGSYGAFYAQKGNFYVLARAVGKGGHSSQPKKCINPIEKLAIGCQRVRESWPAQTEDGWCDVISPTVLSSGSARNAIPDTADVWYNLRFVNDDAPDRLCRLLEESGFVVADKYSTGAPMMSNVDDPEIQRFIAARKSQWPNRKCELERLMAITDARHFSKCGKPVLITGSFGGGAHAVDEWNDLANMDENLAMFEAFFLK